MYTYLILGICTCTVIYVLLQYKQFYHPLVVFNLIWIVIFSLESLHLYGLYESEDRIYYYMLGGIVAFNFGYFIWNYYRKYHRITFKFGKFSSSNLANTTFEPRYIYLYILGILCTIYYLSSAITSIYYLISGVNLGEIRSLVQDSASRYYSSGRSKILNAFSVVLLVPGSSVIQVVGAMDFWFGKRDKKLFAIAILLALLSSLGEGGRTSIMNLLIYLILGYYLSGVHMKHEGNISMLVRKKRRRIIIVSSSAVILFLIWFSNSRTGHAIYKNIYLYFSMQPYMFNTWANNVDTVGVYGYGEASLNGFSFFVLYIIKNVFSIDFPTHWQSIYDLIRATDSDWQIITNIYTRANAYVSTFWFFYLDGRFIGILIGMFAYGVYLAHSFNEAIKYTNIKTVAIFGFIFQGLVYVFIRFPFSNIYYAIAFLMLVFFAFKSVHGKVDEINV